MPMHEFPILIPDKKDGGKRMVMGVVWEDLGEFFFSCYRELKPAEEQALVDDWPAYVASRAAWLAWARAVLNPPFCPKGSTDAFKAHCMSAENLAKLLDYQV